MIFYTESQKANYTHIHAYAFYDLFLSEIKRQNLTDPDFQINIDIDGNVATWTLDTTNSKIQNLFQNLTIHQSFTDYQISDAIAKICQKNNLKPYLKNLNLLKSELNRIKFQTEKPEISDDSLTSDAIDFIKPRAQPKKSCYNRFMKTILTGIRINSDLTLGNFLGAMLPMVRLANRYSSTHHVNIFVPDLHSIISETDGDLQSNMLRTIRYYLAAGLELNENVHFYRQSYVPAHTELAWILNCHTTMGEALRMTQYKDKSHNGNLSTNVGIFDYPILMAADILLYSANYVPVGEDQFQHIELTRNIAERFNHKYGEIFTIPENTENQVKFMFGDTQSFALRIRDLMNPEKKMSKSADSDNSKIMLADLPERIRKKIMSATTDSLADINFDFKTQPGISNLLQILAAITDSSLHDLITDWQHRSQYGELKKLVAERLVEHISNFQAKVQNITDEEIYQLLEEGEKYANQVANQKLLEVQKAVGLR